MSEPPEETRAGSLFAGRPRSSRRRDTAARRALYAVLAPVLDVAGRALFATLRVRVRGAEEELRRHLAGGEPCLPCFWHAELVAGTAYLRKLSGEGLRAGWLVSPSFDGEVPARIAKRWGVHVIRGSATRTGVRALRELQKSVVKEKVSAVLLPDGPSGPARVSKAGVVMLAQLSGAPILPLGVWTRGALRLPTWDGLRVPLPFARVEVEVGELVRVARDLPPEGLEPRRAGLDLELVGLEERARGR
jgi:lysophospholipid acyltransferase (LPLAT)-like uncharacterized protein